jgi:hypothetical protein
MQLLSRIGLGPYEIVRPLGGGGTGEVYHARDNKVRCEVAPKTPPEASAGETDRMVHVIALDDVLTGSVRLRPRQNELIDRHFFAGLCVEVAEERLKVSLDAVMRHWRAARVWAHRELNRTHDA